MEAANVAVKLSRRHRRREADKAARCWPSLRAYAAFAAHALLPQTACQCRVCCFACPAAADAEKKDEETSEAEKAADEQKAKQKKELEEKAGQVGGAGKLAARAGWPPKPVG